MSTYTRQLCIRHINICLQHQVMTDLFLLRAILKKKKKKFSVSQDSVKKSNRFRLTDFEKHDVWSFRFFFSFFWYIRQNAER